MRAPRTVLVLLMALAGSVAPAARVQAAPEMGEVLYNGLCARCHEAHRGASERSVLGHMPPEAIYDVLTTGVMADPFAKGLSDEQKRQIAEYMAGRPMGNMPPSGASAMKNRCPKAPLGDPLQGPNWNGWSASPDNARFQRDPGLTAADVPRLKLKWAFGFPNAITAWSQPTVVGGRLYIGSPNGYVYALDAASGCVYWSFKVKAKDGVRAAVVMGPPIKASRRTRYPLFIGDLKANVYAVDAATGELLWTRRAEEHPRARITGAPTVAEERVYVPVSSVEELVAGDPRYECCTFRGSVVAYDVATGKQVWKSYTIPDEPRLTKASSSGVQKRGPSGGAVWSSPTVDLKNRVLYVSTGNAYTGPDTGTTCAVVVFDLDTGKLLRSFQITPHERDEDFDISASPILRTTPEGKSILIVTSKSGVIYGLDPSQGKHLWEFRFGKGGGLGGGWGSAADEERVYVANSDSEYGPPEAGGLYALSLATGEEIWHWYPPVPDCRARGVGPRVKSRPAANDRRARRIVDEACAPAQAAAVTAIPGVVFSGSTNGIMRAYAAEDGRVLWEYDSMNQSYTTVNGVPGRGGSINAAGPTVVGGMLYMNSGYGIFHNGGPGNVLLAFSVDGK